MRERTKLTRFTRSILVFWVVFFVVSTMAYAPQSPVNPVQVARAVTCPGGYTEVNSGTQCRIFLNNAGSLQSWTSPADWNNDDNTIEVIGAGGSGGASRATSNMRSTGGGGGGYSMISNFAVATPGTTQVSYQVGEGGTKVTRTTNGQTAGNAGGDSWWNNATYPGSGTDNTKAAAKGGGAGQVGTSGTTNGGTGGAAASGWGQVRRSGGSGGTSTHNTTATGGGGAAGNSADGVSGTNTSGTSSATAGGQANGTGASGGNSVSGNGGQTAGSGDNGTEYSTHGSGAGGGGARSGNNSATGGAGGTYGGGGGGAAGSSTINSGDGRNGLIVITYTPLVTGISVSGTSNGSGTVKVAVNGSVQAGSGTISGGNWSVSAVSANSGDVITAWIDGVTDANEAVAVTKYDGTGDVTGMVLNTNVLSIGSDDNQSLTLSDLGTYDCKDDEDIMFEDQDDLHNNLRVEGNSSCINSYTDETMQVLSGNTYVVPADSNMSTDNLTIAGTLTQTGAAAISASGTITSSGTFTGGNGPINASVVTISGGTFTSTSGTFTINNGSWTVSGGTVNANGGLVKFTGDSGAIDTGSALMTFNDVEIALTDFMCCGSFTVSNTMDVAGDISFTTDWGAGFTGGGTIKLQGDFLGPYGNDGITLEVNGTADQDITADKIPSIIINKSSGTLHINGTADIGTWTRTQGTVDLSGSTLTFGGGLTTIDDSVSVFNNIIFNTFGCCGASNAITGTLHIGGNLSNINANPITGGTIEFVGSAAQTINDGSGNISSAIVINKTNNSDTVTLAANTTFNGSLTVTKGVFSQGATFNLTTGSTISIGANGTWSNLGTGDITLGGNVSNAGVITFDGNGASCGDADDIVITGTASWSGAGTFNLTDVDLSNQTASVSITVYSGTDTTGNSGFTFSDCPGAGITISGTTNAGDSIVVKVAVNGSVSSESGITTSGTWEITNVEVESGEVVVVWFDNVADAAESTAVAKYDGTGDMTGIVLNTNVLSIGSGDNQSLTVTDLASYDCVDDEDVMHSHSSNTLTVDGSCHVYTDETIQIESGDTLTIGSSETLSTDNLTIVGTLTQTTTGIITATGNLTTSGTFNGGSGALTVVDYVQTAGTFTSTSGTLTVSGDWTHTAGGSFVHNSGTVSTSGAGSSTTWNVATTETFYNLTIANGGSIATALSSDTYVVEGTFIHSNGTINSGTIQVEAGVTIEAGADGGSATLSFTEAGNQTITNSGGGSTGSLNIAKPSDTVSVSSGNLSINSFTLSSGTFTSTSGILTVRGSWTHTAGGTFNHNDGTVVSGSGGSSTYNFNTSEAFYNFEVAPTSNFTLTISSGDTLIVANTFTHTNGSVETGTLEFRGNVVIAAGADGGNASMHFTGSAAQIYTDNGGNEPDGDITINKTNNSDTVTLASNADWNATNQDLNVTKGVFSQGATFNLLVGAVTVGASGTWSNIGTGDIALGGNVSNAGVITFDANGASCGDNDDIVITGAATWSGAGTFNLTDVNLSNQTASVAITVYSGTDTTGNSGFTFSDCPGAGITISGTTNAGDSIVVKVAVNGVVSGQTGTTASSAWSISSVAVSSGEVVVVFFDNVADSAESTAIAKYDGTGDITGIVLNTNVLSIGSDDNQALVFADLDTYDCSSDEDVMHLAISVVFVVEGNGGGGCTNSYADETLQIESGDTYTVASGHTLQSDNIIISGTLTQTTTAQVLATGGNLTSSGTFNGGSGTINVDGDFTISGGTFTSTSGTLFVGGNYSNSGTFSNNSGTVSFFATDSGNTIGGTLSGTSDFSKIAFTGSGGEWTLGANLETDGASATAISVQAGTFKNGGFSITGNGATDTFSVSNGAFFEMSGTSAYPASFTTYTYGATSTVSYLQTAAATVVAATYGHLNLGTVSDGGAAVTYSLGGNTTAAGTVTIGHASSTNTDILDTVSGSNYSLTASSINITSKGRLMAQNSTVTLTGSGTPFVKTGTFTQGNSTFVYTGTSATNITGATYHHLSLTPAATVTYTLGTGGFTYFTILGNLVIGNGTNAVTVDQDANKATMEIYGDTITINNNAIFVKETTPGASFDGDIVLARTGTITITDNNTIKQDLGQITIYQNGINVQLGSSITVTRVSLRFGTTLNLNGSNTLTVTGSGTGSSRPFYPSFGPGTFTASTGTVAFTGTGATDIDAVTYNNLTINAASGTPTFTLLGNTTVNGALNITNGTFSQGASYNIATGGTTTIGASGTWSNLGTGDITLGGNIVNEGVITFDANGASCGDADDIVITGTASWSGAGTFNLTDVDLSNQTASVAITVYSGTDTTGNSGFTFGGCAASITISGTTDAGNSITVKVAVNGSLTGQSGSTSSGSWSISDVSVASGNIVVVFLDNVDDDAESTAVAKYDGSGNMTGLVLNTNVLSVGSVDNQSLTLTNISSYDCSDDEDVMHAFADNTLSAIGCTNSYTDPTLQIEAGDTLTVGSDETLATGNLNVLGTLVQTTTGAIEIAGDLTIDSAGVFTKGTGGSMTFTGGTTQTITDNNTTKQDLGNIQVSGGGGGGAGETTIATDDFNRSDNGSSLGGNWTQVNGGAGYDNMGITNNTAYQGDLIGNFPRGHYWNADVFEDDQYSEATYLGTHTSIIQLFVRAHASNDTRYIANFSQNSGFRSVEKIVNGSQTTLIAAEAYAEPSDGTVVRLQVVGDEISVLFDGVEVATVSDSSITSGSPGIGAYHASGDSPIFDNWEGGNMSSSSSTTLQLNSSVKATSVVVDASQNLDISSNTLILTGTSTPLTLSGSNTFTVTGSTVEYIGTTATVTATTYNNLSLGGSGTYTLPASDVTLRGNLNIAAGATVTKSASNKLIFATGGGGSQSVTDSNGTKQDLGIIQVSANTGNTTLAMGSSIKATKVLVDSAQTLDMNGSNTLTLTSATQNDIPLDFTSSNFTYSTGTVEFTGATTLQLDDSVTYYNVIINPTLTSGTVEWVPETAIGSLTINNNFTINPSGSGGNLIFYLDKHFTIGGTFTVDGTDSATALVETSSFSRDHSVGALVVNSGGTFYLFAGGPLVSTLNLTGSGTPLTINGGTFTADPNTTVTYSGTSATNITSTTYGHLTLNPASSSPTYTLAAGTLSVNNLTLGTNAVTFTMAEHNPNINITGNLTMGSSTTWTKGTGLLKFMKGGGGTQSVSPNGDGITADDLGRVQVSANGGNTTVNGDGMKVTSIIVDDNQTVQFNGGYITGSGTGSSRPVQLGVGSFLDDDFGGITYAGTGTTEIECHSGITGDWIKLAPTSGSPTYTMCTATSQTFDTDFGLWVGDGTNAVTLDLDTYDPVLNLGGCGGVGIWVRNNATVIKGSGYMRTCYYDDDNATSQDLGDIRTPTDENAQLMGNVKATTLTIESGRTFNLNSHTLILTGTSNPITLTGILDTATGTIEFAPASGESFAIQDLAYYNLKVNKSGTTFVAPSTLAVGNNLEVAAGTLDLNTNDPELEIKDLTIGGTLSAPSDTNKPMVITGNFTNNGTFTHNSGRVYVNPSDSISTIGGSSATTFNDFYSTASGKTIQFKAGAEFGIDGTLSLIGSTGQRITVVSDNPGQQWDIDLQGSSPVVRFVRIRDAGCAATSNSIRTHESTINLGNNDSCWIIVVRGSAVGATGGGSGSSGASGGGGTGGGGGGTEGGSGGEGAEGGGGTGGGGGGSP